MNHSPPGRGATQGTTAPLSDPPATSESPGGAGASALHLPGPRGVSPVAVEAAASGDARKSIGAQAQASWSVEAMRFRFQLGENQFYARKFDVAVLAQRFLDIHGEADDVVLPTAQFGREVAAYAILSHPITHPLPVIRVEKNVIRYASHQYRRGYVRVESTFENYLGGLSSNKRSQLKRKVKKFRERAGGTIDFREYGADRGAAGLREFHKLAREVSAKTYQEKLFQKGLPTQPEFLSEMDERAKKGRARGFLLFDRGRPIAYLYAIIDEAFLTYDFVGYDPDYSDWSPGNVLQYLILERVFEEKLCRIFDFGEGESQYKEFFATDSTRCADIYYFPKTPLGYALLSSQAGLFFLSRGIVITLDKLGLKQRIKQLLRGTKAHVAPPPLASQANAAEATPAHAED